jgi:hypothetical protein
LLSRKGPPGPVSIRPPEWMPPKLLGSSTEACGAGGGSDLGWLHSWCGYHENDCEYRLCGNQHSQYVNQKEQTPK